MTIRRAASLAAVLLIASACGKAEVASPASASPTSAASVAPYPDYPGLAECQNYAVAGVDTLRLLYLVADERATLAELEPERRVFIDAKGSCEEALGKLTAVGHNPQTRAGARTARVDECKEVGDRSGQAIRVFLDAMQYNTHTKTETVQLARQGGAYLGQAASAWSPCFDDPGDVSAVPSELLG